MVKDCLYCGIEYSDATSFCPNCGRPTAKDFKIRQIQESEFDLLRKELKEKDDLIRQLALALTRRHGEDKPEKVASTDGEKRLHSKVSSR